MGLVSKHFEQAEMDLHIHLAMLSIECTAHGFVPEEFCFLEYSEFITNVINSEYSRLTYQYDM